MSLWREPRPNSAYACRNRDHHEHMNTRSWMPICWHRTYTSCSLIHAWNSIVCIHRFVFVAPLGRSSPAPHYLFLHRIITFQYHFGYGKLSYYNKFRTNHCTNIWQYWQIENSMWTCWAQKQIEIELNLSQLNLGNIGTDKVVHTNTQIVFGTRQKSNRHPQLHR